jgi:hypothetical protein
MKNVQLKSGCHLTPTLPSRQVFCQKVTMEQTLLIEEISGQLEIAPINNNKNLVPSRINSTDPCKVTQNLPEANGNLIIDADYDEVPASSMQQTNLNYSYSRTRAIGMYKRIVQMRNRDEGVCFNGST